MADKNIGMLPQVAQLDDESLMVVEQQGTAMKMTGLQFKDFGRQSVVEEVQGYVEDAQEAAQEAVGAVRAVTDMTVSAQALETGEEATVEKTVQAGVYHLAFGLPRGEAGPEGKTGPRGPKGDPGTGLHILGYYDTPADLEAAVEAPEPGDAYGVGTAAPYDIYVFDGVSLEWKNNGPLGGGGGGVVPENVVTAEGGAALSFSAELGAAPQSVTFTDEEEPPLTAEDVSYGEGTVQEALDGLKSSVSNGKSLIASAITDKGVETAQDASFAQMAENIDQISTGIDPSDATATPGDILAPKTAYTSAGKVAGIIPTLAGQTITPGTADQTIANGQYLGGTQVIKGDANLSPANIRQGVTLFGVAGAMTSEFKATLTVTADTGAVVTATHTGGTAVSALSTNGSVVLELPIEGTWTVTAVRGVAQYNSVVVEVSSSYSAALTAEVHIVYYGTSELGAERYYAAGVSVGDYALFGGGSYSSIDAFDKNLTRTYGANLQKYREMLATANAGEYALFAGGLTSEYSGSTSVYVDVAYVDAYDASLTRTLPEELSVARRHLVGTSIGDYAIFAGGFADKRNGVSGPLYEEIYATVDVYDSTLTRRTPLPLPLPARNLAGAANMNYAIFGGGYGSDQYRSQVTAYNANLTRETPAALGIARERLSAARAGNYVVFGGGKISSYYKYDSDAYKAFSYSVDAYDLFLTRTSPQGFSAYREDYAAVTVNEFALFGGGDCAGKYVYNPSAAVDAYDPYVTRTKQQDLNTARFSLSAASVGNFALFAGGITTRDKLSAITGSKIVDAYQYV